MGWSSHHKRYFDECQAINFLFQWAARHAIEFYGINKNKIKVVPFGANLEITHTLEDIKKIIQARPRHCIKLLFIGKQWYRKGGDIVLEIAKELHATGHAVELTLVGGGVPNDVKLPPYVKNLSMISKKLPGGCELLHQLYQQHHFLFMPSRAEAFGIVFCEANAYGMPCITSNVGGIPEVVIDNMNGKNFSLGTTAREYCDYIVNLTHNYHAYEALALSSFNEYQNRLN